MIETESDVGSAWGAGDWAELASRAVRTAIAHSPFPCRAAEICQTIFVAEVKHADMETSLVGGNKLFGVVEVTGEVEVIWMVIKLMQVWASMWASSPRV